MTAQHLVFLVEEFSMEAFLRTLLTRLLPDDRTFEIHSFQGKSDLLGKLQARLHAYASWLPDDWRVVVLTDRDNDDCGLLKEQLETIAETAGLRTRTRAEGRTWQLANRLAIEELEAWYFGDWQAVLSIYGRVSATIPNRAGFRDPDGISGGTWEAFERILKRCGYFTTGLRKVEAARAIAAQLDPDRNRSHSFQSLFQVISEATA